MNLYARSSTEAHKLCDIWLKRKPKRKRQAVALVASRARERLEGLKKSGSLFLVFVPWVYSRFIERDDLYRAGLSSHRPTEISKKFLFRERTLTKSY